MIRTILLLLLAGAIITTITTIPHLCLDFGLLGFLSFLEHGTGLTLQSLMHDKIPSNQTIPFLVYHHHTVVIAKANHGTCSWEGPFPTYHKPFGPGILSDLPGPLPYAFFSSPPHPPLLHHSLVAGLGLRSHLLMVASCTTSMRNTIDSTTLRPFTKIDGQEG